jgi:hypothetical protein
MVCASLQASTVLFDNTAAFPDGSDPIGLIGPLFDSFSTGANAGQLSNAEFALMGDPTSSASISVDLFADNNTSAGSFIANLGTIDDSQLSSVPAIITLNLASNPALVPNTRYWIGLTGPNSSATWDWSLDVTGIGVGTEFLQNALGIFTSDNGAYQMEVEVSGGSSATPEPASLLLSGAALLGCGILLRRRTSR